MANKHKATKLRGELIRNAEETLQIERYWNLADRPVPRIPPKDYHYVKELAHLAMRLIAATSPDAPLKTAVLPRSAQPRHQNRRRQLQLSSQRLAQTTTSSAGITISTKAMSGMVRRTPSDKRTD
jgi:hypothetical protein